LNGFGLPLRAPFEQNDAKENEMDNETGPPQRPKSFLRWAMTPPQSYAVYLICLVLVWGLSFYVGTLRPKKPTGLGPPPVSAPRN
jgi:hypothetical protein